MLSAGDCESEIERMLCQAMQDLDLQPVCQAQIGRHRVDFLLGNHVVVECDGHDYHSSREQRTRDAQRDRALTLSGYRVVRFTGTEIYADALHCAAYLRVLLTRLGL